MNVVLHNGRTKVLQNVFPVAVSWRGKREKAAENLLSEKLIGDLDHMISPTTYTPSDVIHT